MLKKVLVLALVLVFFMSCNNSVDEPTSKFNPPSWIIGEWQDDMGIIEYKFTSNDIIQILAGVEQSHSDSTYSDKIMSDTTYRITTILGDYTEFVMKTSTTIDMYICSGTTISDPTEMTKQ